jgi:hypothetical protein
MCWENIDWSLSTRSKSREGEGRGMWHHIREWVFKKKYYNQPENPCKHIQLENQPRDRNYDGLDAYSVLKERKN